jgi:hypothetical protein
MHPVTSTAPKTARRAVVCRRIGDADIEGVAALLARGFPERAPEYWSRAMRVLRDRDAPEGLPRYGFGVFDNGEPVGALLLIASVGDDGAARGNLSSWYVEPRFRAYSSMMQAMALRLPNLTLFNISPAPHTIDTIEAAGFKSYSTGAFIALAGSGPSARKTRVRRLSRADVLDDDRLSRLASAGCLVLEAAAGGELSRHAFLPRPLRWNMIPAAQLVYSPSVEGFVALARPLGRRLLASGFPFVAIDATGPVAGLGGVFRRGQPKMFRGPRPPRLGDLSDSELVYFGH